MVSTEVKFEIEAGFTPTGDQPAAIRAISSGLREDLHHQTLLGVTGSGKTEVYFEAVAEMALVKVEDGTMRLWNDAGREIVLRAEMDVIVVLANCPHVLDPRDDWQVSPLRISAWRGPVTDQDDLVRCATPEGLRAFENVEDYYRR